ncbi:phage tail assembly chaperone [Pseudomonas aeruginosa]
MGWEGVSAEFSVEALAKLVNNYHAPAVTAIVDKFLAELTEVRRGN